jgi:hypothetical protein
MWLSGTDVAPPGTPDAGLMTGLACLNHARTLMHWAGYYLAHAEPSREATRAARDLHIAHESLSHAMTTCAHPGAEPEQLDIF